MKELKKIGRLFTSKSVGTGPSSYEKIIYRAAISQRSRNTDLAHTQTRSTLTHLQFFSMVSAGSFCPSVCCSSSLTPAICHNSFSVLVLSIFFCIPTFCPKVRLCLLPLQSLCLFHNLPKSILLFFSYISSLLLLIWSSKSNINRQSKSHIRPICHNSFSVLVLSSFFCMPTFCPKVRLCSLPLQSLCLFHNLPKSILMFFSYISSLLLLIWSSKRNINRQSTTTTLPLPLQDTNVWMHWSSALQVWWQ